ncbi:MAG: tryptophan--tRNA ligase [Elusimicrobiota bacterium]
MEKKGKILSGMRPSGKLHIGHLWGAISNWVGLQDEYDCHYMVADLHALTTEYAETSQIRQNTLEMIADWLACGIDPARSILFRQSRVKQHSELHLFLSMIIPLGWLFRLSTYKEQLKELKERDLHTYGFLGYPVLQAADIVLYKANAVPVGEDQLPHLELSREIVRRFNGFYGKIFPEPKAILTQDPRIPGTDGRKMSKSYNNAIFLSDAPEDILKKTMSMFTDPKKIKVTDPGHPGKCVVFAFHKIYSENYKEIEKQCKAGVIGCVKDKKDLAACVIKALEPVREKRDQIIKNPNYVEKILKSGEEKASEIAEKTMREVKEAVKL